MGNLRLKDFIRAIRACKTAADERAVIAKESAAIRTCFKEDSSLDTRHINLSKLLYIHMLGHAAHFGQIECLKLVAGGKYADKRLGYLGIMLLLDEAQEVLTLVTNSLKNSNMYAVALALCTMGNIASAEMARDLAPEIDKLLSSNNSYIKKKVYTNTTLTTTTTTLTTTLTTTAALCAVKILKKVPDLVDQFVPRAKALLNERNHSCLLTGVSLITEICSSQPSYLDDFRSMIPQLNRHLKSLLTAGTSPEHDINGINDPFLQIEIIKLLRVLGKGDPQASDAMNDVLAQLSTNTDGSKNVGNAILYEICLTIMDIEADSGLRVLAINILGRFLSNPDNNIRYVALNTLAKTIAVDINAVQRHRTTILECLQDTDVSIRRRALDLCYFLINEVNIRVMVRELLLFLETAEQEFKVSMPARICAAADQFAPNKRWHIDTILRVFKLAGAFVKDDVLANFIKLVASVPELHSYAVYKQFYYLKQDLSQEALVLAGVWTIGEYCDVLLLQSSSTIKTALEDSAQDYPISNGEDIVQNVSYFDVVELMENILSSPYNNVLTTEYVLTALSKITARAKNAEVTKRITGILRGYTANIDLEIQQRGVEYLTLLTNSNLDKYQSEVLARVPVPLPTFTGERRVQQFNSASNSPVKKGNGESLGNGGGLLDDLLSLSSVPSSTQVQTGGNILDDFGGLSIGQSNTSSPTKSSQSNYDVLADVFGSQNQQAPAKSKNDILGLFNSTLATQTPKQQQQVGGFDIFGVSPTKVATSQPNQSQNNPDTLSSLFGGSSMMQANSTASTHSSPSSVSGNSNAGFGFSQPSNFIGTSVSPSQQEVVAYTKNQLTLTLKPTIEAGPDSSSKVCSILAVFKNGGVSAITDLTLQIAVPKSFKLQLFPASGTTVSPLNNGTLTQQFKVMNPSAGTVEGKSMPVKLRLKLAYNAQNGAVKVDEIVDFPGFNGFSW